MGTLASARHGTLSELAQPSGTPPSPRGLHPRSRRSRGPSSVLHRFRTFRFGDSRCKTRTVHRTERLGGGGQPQESSDVETAIPGPCSVFSQVNRIPFTVVKDTTKIRFLKIPC